MRVRRSRDCRLRRPSSRSSPPRCARWDCRSPGTRARRDGTRRGQPSPEYGLPSGTTAPSWRARRQGSSTRTCPWLCSANRRALPAPQSRYPGPNGEPIKFDSARRIPSTLVLMIAVTLSINVRTHSCRSCDEVWRMSRVGI